MQSVAVDVGFKVGVAAALGQLSGLKRGSRDNRLPFSACSSWLKEFASEMKVTAEKVRRITTEEKQRNFLM